MENPGYEKAFEQSLHEALDRMIQHMAIASDPIFLLDFLVHNLPEDAYGCFKRIPIDNNYEEDEVYTQIAIQEDGPGAHIGLPLSPVYQIQCDGPVSRIQYENCQKLQQDINEISDILDTVWTQERPEPLANLGADAPFDEEAPF